MNRFSVLRQSLSRHGIGASEIAAIVGMSPYASPWDVWLRKTGQAPDVETSPEIEWGHRNEPAIRQKYADVTGATLHVPSESLFHAEQTWARATPDAIVLTDEGQWSHLMQAKNVGYWPGKDWDAAPPVYVQLQELWEMHVTRLARADIAALIAGSRYVCYTVHRDDRMIADLVDIATDFWRRVETRTAPRIDDSDACRDHFTRRLLKAPAVELAADEDLEKVIAQWRRARADLKQAERTVKTMRNVVLSTMVNAQADRIVSSLGVPKLARSDGKTHHVVNWQYVAETLGNGAPQEFRALVEAATTTETTEPTVTLREPSEWSKENK